MMAKRRVSSHREGTKAPSHAQIRRMGCALQPTPNGGLPSRTKPRAGARYTVRDTWWVPIRRSYRTTPPRAGVPRAKHVRHLLWVQDTSGPRHRHLAPSVVRAERALAESLAPSRGVRRDSKPLGLPPTLAAVVSEQQDTPRGFDSRSGPKGTTHSRVPCDPRKAVSAIRILLTILDLRCGDIASLWTAGIVKDPSAVGLAGVTNFPAAHVPLQGDDRQVSRVPLCASRGRIMGRKIPWLEASLSSSWGLFSSLCWRGGFARTATLRRYQLLVGGTSSLPLLKAC